MYAEVVLSDLLCAVIHITASNAASDEVTN